MQIKKIQISVIICSYNRANYLDKAINSLLDQSINRDLFEIIIIDNNSTDNTKKLVKSYQKKIKLPKIILTSEKRQGLDSARNRGIKYAHGQYLAFLDDDSLPDKNWLKCTLFYFENIKPKPMAVGGVILPVYESHKPFWFSDKYETDYKGSKERKLKKSEAFSGSNMIFQKKILKKYGCFDSSVGMKGKNLSVGEETAIFGRIWRGEKRSDISFYYSPKLIVRHMVSPYKTTVSYRLKRSFAGGQSLYMRNVHLSAPEKFYMLIKYFLIIVFSPLIFLWYALFSPNIKAAVVESFSPFFYAGGFIFAFFGLFIYFQQR